MTSIAPARSPIGSKDTASSRRTSFHALETLIEKCKGDRTRLDTHSNSHSNSCSNTRLEISLSKKIDLLIGIAKTIHEAHQNGIIYQNISPKNILIKYHNEYDVDNPIILGGHKEPPSNHSSETPSDNPSNKFSDPNKAYMLLHLNVPHPTHAKRTTNNDLDLSGDWHHFGLVCFHLIFLSQLYNPYQLENAIKDNTAHHFSAIQKQKIMQLIKQLLQIGSDNKPLDYLQIRDQLNELQQLEETKLSQHKSPNRLTPTKPKPKQNQHHKTQNKRKTKKPLTKLMMQFLLPTFFMTLFLTALLLTLVKIKEAYHQLPQRADMLSNFVSKPAPITAPQKPISH